MRIDESGLEEPENTPTNGTSAEENEASQVTTDEQPQTPSKKDEGAEEAEAVAEVTTDETPAVAPVTDEAAEPAEAAAPVDETSAEVAETAQAEEEDEDDFTASDEPDDDDEPEDEAGGGAVAETADSQKKTRFSRGQLLDAVILRTSPTEIVIQIDEETEGIVPGRELERMSRKMLDELEEGKPITVFVVNPYDHRGSVVLSINRAMEEMDWKRAEEFRKSQEIYTDIVAGYNRGGLIVRFGRLRGFVPQSQISDERRRRMTGETPEERYGVMVNDDIFVKVMEVDRSRNRLILSERAASRERREANKASLIEGLEVGNIFEGRVVSLEDFGAFVDIGGAEGLVHLTEISWKHVTHPKDSLEVGQMVKVEVINVDSKRKRIGLSIKRQEPDPWDEVAITYQVGDLVQATVTKLTKFGAFARLVDTEDIEGLVHISELSEQRVTHPRDVVVEDEKLTLRVVKIDVKNRRLGLSLKRVNSMEYLDRDLSMLSSDDEPDTADAAPVDAADDTGEAGEAEE